MQIVEYGSAALWVGLVSIVLVALGLDYSLDTHTKGTSVKKALIWTAVWVGLAVLVGAGIYGSANFSLGAEVAKAKTLEYFTGYLIEKSLSIDNLFLFLLIFQFFQVPAHLQHRVLAIGIISALVLRALMIVGGAYLITHFAWLLYVFGAFLVYSGAKILWAKEAEKDLSKNFVLRFFNKYFRISHEYHGQHFWVRTDQGLVITPLLVALVMLECTDVIFALDSIPAIFAITTDPFLVFSSNVLAILGLRALYFVLAHFASQFHLLRYGLGLVLLFIGAKMLLADFLHIPTLLSLAVVIVVVSVSIGLSYVIPPKDHHSL